MHSSKQHDCTLIQTKIEVKSEEIERQGCTRLLCCINKGAAQYVYNGLHAYLTIVCDLPACL